VVCHLFSLYTQKDVWIKVAVSAQHKKLVRPKQLSTSLEYFSEKRQSIQTHFFFLSVNAFSSFFLHRLRKYVCKSACN